MKTNWRMIGGCFLGALLLACCAVTVSASGVASAKAADAEATENVQKGLRAEDFAAQGIALGQEVTEDDLTDAFGKLLYSDEVTRWGVPMQRYLLKNHATVLVIQKTQRVAEIELEKEGAIGRDGIKYGATSYYIQNVYGKTKRVNLDGAACFIYTNPEHPHQRLICTVDHDESSLIGMRWTALPLTEDEAGGWTELIDEDADDTPKEIVMGQTVIDISALPKDGDDVPQLGGLTK